MSLLKLLLLLCRGSLHLCKRVLGCPASNFHQRLREGDRGDDVRTKRQRREVKDLDPRRDASGVLNQLNQMEECSHSIVPIFHGGENKLPGIMTDGGRKGSSGQRLFGETDSRVRRALETRYGRPRRR